MNIFRVHICYLERVNCIKRRRKKPRRKKGVAKRIKRAQAKQPKLLYASRVFKECLNIYVSEPYSNLVEVLSNEFLIFEELK
jgi:hypothetical protein